MKKTIALFALLFVAATPRVVKRAAVLDLVTMTSDTITLRFEDGSTLSTPRRVVRIDDRRGLPAPRLTLEQRREIREAGKPSRATTIEEVALLGRQPVVVDVKYNSSGRIARLKLHLYPSRLAAQAAVGERAAEQ